MKPIPKDMFLELAKNYNVIPLAREIVADTETPVSLYLKLQGKNPQFLLESAQGGEKNARYSFIGLNPFCTFVSRDKTCEIRRESQVNRVTGDPFLQIRKLLASYKVPKIPDCPPFFGGAVGFMGYELIQFIEDIGPFKEDLLDIPDCYLTFTRVNLVYDHRKKTLIVINNVIIDKGKDPEMAYVQGMEYLEEVVRQVKGSSSYPAVIWDNELSRTWENESMSISPFDQSKFCEEVLKIKNHIFCGDIFQGVLSRRVTLSYNKDPFLAYRVLRSINPSPYMFYLNFPEVQLAGASPEMLVRLEGGVVTTRPIAGTRPRGKTAGEEALLEEDLINDPKERAEHLMLVDLGRNDLGRVCNYGSIKVKEIFKVDKFSHVMHMVSEVEGTANTGLDAVDVFKACFPAGTVTGAPKVRAMDIINKREPIRRGPYAGAVGYFSFSGDMDTCITIRTIVIKNGKAHIQAGAGIVADSQPLREFIETKEKARALLKVLAILQKEDRNSAAGS